MKTGVIDTTISINKDIHEHDNEGVWCASCYLLDSYGWSWFEVLEWDELWNPFGTVDEKLSLVASLTAIHLR